MQLAIRYSVVVAITLAEITIGEFFERGSPLNQLINSLLFASLLFIDGVIFPLILDSLISSAAFSMSILMLLLLAGSSDPYLLLDYISGVGVSFFLTYLTRSIWDRALKSLKLMKRRPNLRILAISTVIGVVVYFLTGSALIVAGVVLDSILLSFLDRTGLSLLSALSWISLPYLIMADPGSQETGLCIGRVEKVLARSLIPGFFQSGYRYKWFSVERPFCIELDKLKNFNTVILGSSGYGKSSLAKLILSKLDVDYIVFDLHGEYTDLKGKRIDVASNGINPLSLFGRSPKQRSIEISMMLKSIFNLGNIQTMDLSNLLIEGYQEKGIYDEDERSWILSPPTFRDLILLLERKKRASLNSADLSRWGSIEPYLRFLDSNVFNGSEDISKIIEGKTILDFSRVSISNIKYVLMETILTSILGTMYTQKYGSLRRLVVIDEAPFLLEKESGEILAERLFAEGRKFGYGFVMISQYSSKLEKMINNASLVMVMGMKEPNEVNYISRLLGDRSYESERVIYETVTGLERGMIMTRDITVNDIIVVRLHQG